MASVGRNMLKQPLFCVRNTCGHLFFYSKRENLSCVCEVHASPCSSGSVILTTLGRRSRKKLLGRGSFFPHLTYVLIYWNFINASVPAVTFVRHISACHFIMQSSHQQIRHT